MRSKRLIIGLLLCQLSVGQTPRGGKFSAKGRRERRQCLAGLVANLDLALPEGARRGGFKGAGPRSTGVWGRSFFNVISDTIAHLRDKGLDGAEKMAPTPLASGELKQSR